MLFPSDAFLSGLTAAVLYGVPLPRVHEESLTIHATVPEGHRALAGAGLRGHAARVVPADVTTVRGLRVSTPSRMWCELGATLKLHDLVAAGDYLVNRTLPYVTIAGLAAALRTYPGQRGLKRLWAALVMLDDNSASRRESHLRVLAIQQGLRGFVMNRRIRASSGHIYYGDLVFVKERVIVEYQSRYHLEPEQQLKDMTRRSRLEADGWAVMYVNSEDLRDPRELAARIRTLMVTHSRLVVGATRV